MLLLNQQKNEELRLLILMQPSLATANTFLCKQKTSSHPQPSISLLSSGAIFVCLLCFLLVRADCPDCCVRGERFLCCVSVWCGENKGFFASFSKNCFNLQLFLLFFASPILFRCCYNAMYRYLSFLLSTVLRQKYRPQSLYYCFTRVLITHCIGGVIRPS